MRAKKKLTATVLIGSVKAILFTIAEETALDAIAITARERALRTYRLIGVQERLHFALLVFQLAILDGVLPVACLFLNVKEQTGWTTDRLQTLFAIQSQRRYSIYNEKTHTQYYLNEWKVVVADEGQQLNQHQLHAINNNNNQKHVPFCPYCSMHLVVTCFAHSEKSAMRK